MSRIEQPCSNRVTPAVFSSSGVSGRASGREQDLAGLGPLYGIARYDPRLHTLPETSFRCIIGAREYLMRLLLQFAIGILLAQGSQAGGQEPTGPQQGFKIALPPTVKSEQVEIQYFLTGAFGGYGSFIRAKPGIQEYQIDMMFEGQPANTLKAIVLAPGCQIVTISVPLLSSSSRKADFACQPAVSLTLSGRIQPLEFVRGHEYEVEISLTAPWAMVFFGYADGIVPTFHITSVTPGDDGSFRVQLPDLTRDPVTSSFGSGHATLAFAAREKRTGNSLGRLEPTDARDNQFGDLRLESVYPDEVIFRAR
jgi:hypothetical protein